MARLDLGRRDDGAEGVSRHLLPLIGHLPQAAQRPGLLTSSTRAAAEAPVSARPAVVGQREGARVSRMERFNATSLGS